ncbi:MAG TPA: flagellar hook-basal body protein [Armatimonadota bacterium]|nr:flagellar hook-basal body protein [Armatimonadota bacterium]
MIRGLYSSADGLLVQAARTDVIAGNLAGASVPGFRRDVLSVTAFGRALEYTAGGAAAGVPNGVLLEASTELDLRPGSMRRTGAECDIALEGPGYFCVQTAAGEAYTRGGAFRLDASHQLVTAAGDAVVGQAGPIRIDGADIAFRENGDVVVDGTRVDRLKLVDFPAGVPMRKLGRGLLGADPASARPHDPAKVRVREGYLEGANVDAISEMVGMISALRAFEASQRALQANDQTLEKAINEIGRV